MKALLYLYLPSKFKLFYTLLLIVLSSPVFGDTSLWQISKGSHTLYLGGTIHVLKKEDYPLPAEFTKAFTLANKLVLETNIDETQTPAFAQKMTKLLRYGANESLKQSLNAETFTSLSRYFSNRGLSIESFMKVKPVMVVLTLSMMELTRIGMTGVGVDEYFYRKAQSANKPIVYFETVDQQLNYIVNMGAGRENKLVQQTLSEMSKMESIIEKMKSAWLAGDEAMLADTTIADMVRDFPDLYQNLLVKRNNNWMPIIEKMLLDNDVELILVGALHLVGNKGLLQQLRSKGYQVNHFK